MVEKSELLRYLLAVAPLLVGWILDRLIADPQWLPHPVVGFGKLISFFEHRFNNGERRVEKGGIVAIGLVVVVFLCVWCVLWLLPIDSGIQPLG